MQNLDLKKLSNKELWLNTKNLVQKEKHLTLQVLEHLSEIQSRKLYLQKGFSSLFEYTVKELGYSEGSAYRRIKAMKLCKEVPETKSKIKTGNLNLTTASQIQTFFEKQDKKSKKENSSHLLCSVSSQRRIGASFRNSTQLNNQKQELIKRVEGRSQKETERLLSEIDPMISREKVRSLGGGQTEIKLVINLDDLKKAETLKNLLSHKNPNMSYTELFSLLVQMGIDKYDYSKKTTLKTKPKQKSVPELKNVNKHKHKLNKKPSKQTTRYIPKEVKKYIWQRDNGRCSYICSETKRRCTSKHLIQIDHIHPYALGGSSKPQNLRLLCASHNQYRNKKYRSHFL